jgi:hypothetical protein
MFSIICIIIFVPANGLVSANTNDKPPSLKEIYTQVGYKTVEEAVKEFENHFKQDVKLPKVRPSIPFTHQFGRFYEDKNYDVNDSLDIEFLNEKSPGNHYKIVIRPLKNKLVFKNRGEQKMYTLQNGQNAIYFEHQRFNFLVFEKDPWQYMLGINKKVSNEITPDVLVNIANSIQ